MNIKDSNLYEGFPNKEPTFWILLANSVEIASYYEKPNWFHRLMLKWILGIRIK